MTKFQFVEQVASEFGITKKLAGQIIEDTFERIGKSVASGQRFWWPGFGVWSPRSRKARKIRNPQTGELMKLPKTYSVGFSAAGELRRLSAKKRRTA